MQARTLGPHHSRVGCCDTKLLTFATLAWATVAALSTMQLPLNAINSKTNMVNNPGQLSAWFKELKGGGVTGVMSDTWWGITEPQPKAYNFTGYQSLLKVQCSTLRPPVPPAPTYNPWPAIMASSACAAPTAGGCSHRINLLYVLARSWCPTLA